MEVLLTLTMVALIVTPIMIQQGALIKNADRASRRAIVLEQAQLFLYETEASLQPGDTTHEAHKKLDDAYETTLQFKRTPIAAQSAFGKFTNLVQDQVTVSWQESGQKMQATVLMFRYQLPVPQEKKA